VGVVPTPTPPTGDLVVHTAGNGPPVILLHGLTSSHREWLGLKSALAPGFTCLAFDARGHGTRRADNASVCVGDLAADLAAVVASVAPRRPVVVGHCIGAATIFEFVRRHGDAALAGIVLVDQSPRMLTAPDWELGVYSGFSAVDNMAFEWQMRRDPAQAWLRLMACGFNAEARAHFDANTPVVQHARERLAALPSAAWLALWRSIAHKDYRDEVATLSVPMLAVLGGASNLFDTARLGRWYAGSGPHAAVVRYEGADHAPHAKAPARFARDVAGFAARCAGMRATADAC
jgi:pimeloyl-ACP methyl ester carboxylesterase